MRLEFTNCSVRNFVGTGWSTGGWQGADGTHKKSGSRGAAKLLWGRGCELLNKTAHRPNDF
jgi:hypothetical protein